jgi:hypothetical protein
MTKFTSDDEQAALRDLGYCRHIGWPDRSLVGALLLGAMLNALNFINSGRAFAFFAIFFCSWGAYVCWASPCRESWIKKTSTGGFYADLEKIPARVLSDSTVKVTRLGP